MTPTRPFSKILIANRGEIACRVIRTARALGYRTVAVFSDADARAPHVAMADEAVRLGPAPAAESYLHIARLLQAARATGADAVHPGYGFLSERADFARACAEAGLLFIGPPAEAIDAMGDKAGAKRRMAEAGVPCAPGYSEPATAGTGGADPADPALHDHARQLGYPLLVKAVAGGGGRGMRRVDRPQDLADALASARREAQAAFGDGRLMLERWIEDGRHIEIQVFADAHGHAVHLGERDCTAQRRRQKVIEEAPSPVVDAAMRARLGADAVAAAQAVGYVGAGTVEFIVDQEGRHYFLEMNTRLQVEHPVTELVTGTDLVAWQLRVAAGEPLSAWLPEGQASVRFDGHAIEARLYAEAPHAGFAPQTGRVLHWDPAPAVAAGRGSVRIDDGVAPGADVTPWYDPMLAKVIVHGTSRDDAIRRLQAALADAPLLGVTTNARFLIELLGSPDFRQAAMTTARLDEWQSANPAPALYAAPQPSEDAWWLVAALAARGEAGSPPSPACSPSDTATTAAGLGATAFTLHLQCGDTPARHWRVRLGGSTVQLRQADQTRQVEVLGHDAARARWRLALDGVHRNFTALCDGHGAWHVAEQGAGFAFHEPSARPEAPSAAEPGDARAPVTGRVVQVSVSPGERVETGQPLVCVEAMKMEMWVNAKVHGTVRAVHVALGDAVASGALLCEVDPAPATATPEETA